MDARMSKATPKTGENPVKLPAFLTAIALFCLSAAAEAPRPNIVLIMADDMGYSDIGCYGAEINTPNLDRMAGEGLRFTQFYNAARCCPTRASLLTGLYPHQAGMGSMITRDIENAEPGPYQGFLNDQSVTIAEVLKEAGYTTLMSGKWHVGEERPHWPTDRGFDKYYGLISGGMNYFDIEKGKAEGIERGFAIDGEPHDPPNKNWYLTDAISDHAVKYVQDYGEDGDPFFLYVSYTAPHWPLHAPEEDIQRYLGKYMDGWDAVREARYKRMIEMGLIDESWPLSPSDGGVADWEAIEDKAAMDRKMAVYAAQIEVMDRGIGRILDALDATGSAENTLVLFLSDNGGCHEGGALGFDRRENGIPPGGVDSYMSYGRSWANASNTPFRMYKHWVHEGGSATPLVARWPAGIEARGAITHETGHVIDFMATFAELAGAEYPEHYNGKPITPLEGRSLLPILQGGARPCHKALYWEHNRNRAIRQGPWKLVAPKDGDWALYNLEADRTELTDLREERPEIAVNLQSRYEAWAERVGVR